MAAIDPQQLAAIAALWKRTGREIVTRFTGTSMEPSIADGAEVTLLCVDEVKTGDIVAYAWGDRVIVHRLVAKWGERFVARGDANFLPDSVLVDRGDIIGKIAAPPPARAAFGAPAFLAGIGMFGARTAMRIVGVLRRMHRAVRSVAESLRKSGATRA